MRKFIIIDPSFIDYKTELRNEENIYRTELKIRDFMTFVTLSNNEKDSINLAMNKAYNYIQEILSFLLNFKKSKFFFISKFLYHYYNYSL